MSPLTVVIRFWWSSDGLKITRQAAHGLTWLSSLPYPLSYTFNVSRFLVQNDSLGAAPSVRTSGVSEIHWSWGWIRTFVLECTCTVPGYRLRKFPFPSLSVRVLFSYVGNFINLLVIICEETVETYAGIMSITGFFFFFFQTKCHHLSQAV